MVLLGSCFLSFSHLVPVSPDDDLPDRGLLFRFGAFSPLLEPVTSLLLTRQLDPAKAACSDLVQGCLGYLDLSSLFLDPGLREGLLGPFVCEDDLCGEDLVGLSRVVFFEEFLDLLRVSKRFLGEAAHCAAGILLVLDALSYRSFIAFTFSRSSSQAWTAISTMADLFRGPLSWSS